MPAIDKLWTVENVEILRTLWDDGLSASKIAVEIGGVTRSAVLGKAFRLNLTKRMTLHSVKRERSSLSPKPKKPKGYFGRQFAERKNEVEVVPLPVFLGISFFETTKKTCMYPHGEGRLMMFCGQPRKEDSSFCLGHHRICYFRVDHNKRADYVEAA